MWIVRTLALGRLPKLESLVFILLQTNLDLNIKMKDTACALPDSNLDIFFPQFSKKMHNLDGGCLTVISNINTT